MRTVELVLDDALDDTVREVWARLHAAGLPSLATHDHPTNRPHLTVAVAADLPPAVTDALAALPLRVQLGEVHAFAPPPGSRRGGAVVWRVVPDDDLRSLHAAVWAALDGVETSPMHTPAAWDPHISLALRARPEAASEALALLSDLYPARGLLTGARSYDLRSRDLRQLA